MCKLDWSAVSGQRAEFQECWRFSCSWRVPWKQIPRRTDLHSKPKFKKYSRRSETWSRSLKLDRATSSRNKKQLCFCGFGAMACITRSGPPCGSVRQLALLSLWASRVCLWARLAVELASRCSYAWESSCVKAQSGAGHSFDPRFWFDVG